MNQLVKLLRITGPTILVSVAAMFFVASPSFAQQKGASSSEMQTREVRINGVTLHYIERGQGTPVVLVHGTLGDYRTFTQLVIAANCRRRNSSAANATIWRP